MIQPGVDPGVVWTLVVVLAVGAFLMRLSFILLYTWMDEFPPRVERSLRFVPVAVLSAIIVPAVVPFDSLVAGTFLDARLLAAAVATVVAWRTENMLATIVVGMGVLWGVGFLVG